MTLYDAGARVGQVCTPQSNCTVAGVRCNEVAIRGNGIFSIPPPSALTAEACRLCRHNDSPRNDRRAAALELEEEARGNELCSYGATAVLRHAAGVC